MKGNEKDKIDKVLSLFRECGVDTWAADLKDKYVGMAEFHLEEVAVSSVRKEPLKKLVKFLVQRDH
jgi:geranylgeranyl diphosphate synthase type II